MLFSSGIADST